MAVGFQHDPYGSPLHPVPWVMFRLRRTHAIIALTLFGMELLIAAFVRDRFVRPMSVTCSW